MRHGYSPPDANSVFQYKGSITVIVVVVVIIIIITIIIVVIITTTIIIIGQFQNVYPVLRFSRS